ncbi:hypothetical protein CDAR_376091 [Caerostris darwini]|uniref:Uncharacterized protein n=1 Tax=Caerostris darwini TaxID=1538125 RepID=A0AAV4VFT7_9ARAC|nr:hypothetical protein CDAR_376091 [Caerostris darwini]
MESEQNICQPATLIREISDEYVLINQGLLRKACGYKLKLTQTAAKIGKLKVEDPAASQLHAEMAATYKLLDNIKFEYGLSLFQIPSYNEKGAKGLFKLESS